MTVKAYLDSIKDRLVTDPTVTGIVTVRERSTLVDGYLRARPELRYGSQLEFSEYVQYSPADEIAVVTYSYHWADASNQLIKRWDNTSHFPDLPGFPDHIHEGATGQV